MAQTCLSPDVGIISSHFSRVWTMNKSNLLNLPTSSQVFPTMTFSSLRAQLHRGNPKNAFSSETRIEVKVDSPLNVRTITPEEAIDNRISLIGKIASEPELIWEDDGTAVTNSWLEVRKWPGSDYERFYLQIYGQGEDESLPEQVCNYVAVGDQVMVEGVLEIKSEEVGDAVAVVLVEEFKRVGSGVGAMAAVSSRNSFPLANTEDEWANLFKNPDQYWDNRSNKLSPRSPDFKNKVTKAGLWMNDKRLPYWVSSRLPELDREKDSDASVEELTNTPTQAVNNTSWDGGSGWP